MTMEFMTMLHCQTCSSEYSACTRTNKEIKCTILFMFLSFLYIVTVLNIGDFLMNRQ